MKLTVGDIIQVHGFVMLKGLEDGQKYKVSRISEKHGGIYWFSKPRGKKEIIGHYASNVDITINGFGDNCIEIVKGK